MAKLSPKQKIENSRVAKSPKYKEIMDAYYAYGSIMSIRHFYEEHVEKNDPTITPRAWEIFQKNLKEYHLTGEMIGLEPLVYDPNMDIAVQEEENLKKMMAIAGHTLDELIKDPKMLSCIKVGDRIKWLMDVMSARDARMNIALKKKEQDRKDTIWDEIMKGAQYGAITEGDISFAEEPKPLPKRELVKIIKNEPSKVVEFDPANL